MFGFAEDFAARVLAFETKLAQIQMKPDQSRLFDQTYTITTLDDFIAKVNELKSLEAKQENYPANTVAEDDADVNVLTTADWTVDEATHGAMSTFLNIMYEPYRQVMSDNYKANYTDKGTAPKDPETAEFRIIVFDGDYFRRIFNILLPMHNKQDVLAYLQYQTVRWGKEYCTKELDEVFFDFYARTLRGQKEQKSAEKRTVERVNSWVGELLGKVYVTRYFSEADKQNVKGMIEKVLEIMKASLQKNDWLTDETKQKALDKLGKFVTKIGFPDKWKDYGPLELLESDTLLQVRAKQFAFDVQTEFMEKINSTKDKGKWEMHPQQVNAYFHPLNNEIVFPAAILQPPFYHTDIMDVQICLEGEAYVMPHALLAINYGGIGAVIAHEITHGYDDQGRKFDSDGNCVDWWQPEDAELFKTKTDLMKKQAETHTYLDTNSQQVHTMNGDLTMGENLADLGGMSLAVQALEKVLSEDPAVDNCALNKYRQLFFASWANVWKNKQTNADAVNKLAVDPHAPGAFRANLVKNIDSFYEAFDIQPDHVMYIAPEARVQMW